MIGWMEGGRGRKKWILTSPGVTPSTLLLFLILGDVSQTHSPSLSPVLTPLLCSSSLDSLTSTPVYREGGKQECYSNHYQSAAVLSTVYSI